MNNRFRLLLLITLPAAVSFLTADLSAQVNDDCLACHEDNSLTMEKNGKTLSLFVDKNGFKRSPHAKLVCTACHVGFDKDNVPHKEKIEPVNCQSCHTDAPVKHRFHASMMKANRGDPSLNASCKQCHGTHSITHLEAGEGIYSAVNQITTCGKCHAAAKESFSRSAHGVALKAGVVGAPDCITCHQQSLTFGPGADSLQVKQAQTQVCMNCHRDDPNVRSRVAPSAGFIASYDESVHASALAGGNARAANCVNCHGGHDVVKTADPASHVNRNRIAETCGACHSPEEEAFRGSIHGVAVSKGVMASPTCTGCHGEHKILGRSNPNAPIAPTNVSSQVCAPCHSSVRLSEKYGLAADRFRSFEDSFHGLAGRHGSVEVANCASCHGSHDIKPSTDPSSRVHKDNLIANCGTCHPGANENFTKGTVHVIASEGQDDVLYFVATAYIILIIAIVGGMVVHNILDFITKSKRILRERRDPVSHEPKPHRLYVRMTLNERLQHGTLVISFITLVLTGFALRFPDAWWVVPFRDYVPGAFELRGLLHRIAAVVMVLASLYHTYYLFFVPRGKQLLRDLLPVWKDLTDAIGVMKYNLGLSKVKPKFDRFSYIEKAEYWALVWGTVVMGVTGVILWFDNYFLGILTKLGWDVARTVHYYEAWLATLAIIVWHFYFVIFNPDVYPINLAFWKGTLTHQEMEEEHPLELERLEAEHEEMIEVHEGRKNDRGEEQDSNASEQSNNEGR